jgi:hypothetical protein
MTVDVHDGDCTAVDAAFDRLFGAPAQSISVAVHRHLAECIRCRTLYAWFSEAGPAPVVPAPVSERIRRSLHASLSPVRARLPIAAIVGRLAVVFLVSVLLASAVRGVDGWRAMTPWQIVVMAVTLSAGALLLCASVSWQSIPGSLPWFDAPAALAIPIAALLIAVFSLFPWHVSSGFVADGARCLEMGLGMAIPAALVFWLLTRRSSPGILPRSGSTLGAIAGWVSVTILQFSCSRQEAGHLVAWHGAVLVIAIASGALIGCRPRATSPRSRARRP